MQKFKLLIISPEKKIFEGEVISVYVEGLEGHFQVLAQHAPIVTLVKEGTFHVVDTHHKKIGFPVSGGIFEFSLNEAKLLAD